MTAKNNTLLIYPAGVYAFGLAMTMLFPWQPEDDRLQKGQSGAVASVHEPADELAKSDPVAIASVKATLASSSEAELSVCAKDTDASAMPAAASQTCSKARQIGHPASQSAGPAQKLPAEAVKAEGELQQSL